MVHPTTGYLYFSGQKNTQNARMTIEYFYNGKRPYGWGGK